MMVTRDCWEDDTRVLMTVRCVVRDCPYYDNPVIIPYQVYGNDET
jgi:hypothetical protein